MQIRHLSLPNPQTGSQKPRLFDLVRQKIQTLHYSPQTEKTYIGWIKCFIFFHGKRHPIEMREKEKNLKTLLGLINQEKNAGEMKGEIRYLP